MQLIRCALVETCNKVDGFEIKVFVAPRRT